MRDFNSDGKFINLNKYRIKSNRMCNKLNIQAQITVNKRFG
jgi:hypothetical protein